MAERELAERLDEVVEAILARRAAPADPELALLGRVAAALAGLPDPRFRARLAAELQSRAASMRRASATPWAPAGFHSLTPYVIVRGAGKMIEFMERAFGAEEEFRTAEPDGSIVHAQVRIGESVLELADGGGAWPARPAAIHLYLPDADEAWARAVEAGATTLVAPTDMPYGDREADISDPFGNNWYLGTRREDGPVPPGFPALRPTLHVPGTDRLIDFLREAFAAEELDVTRTPDGTVVHAQLKLGDALLELGEPHGFVGPMPCAVHYYVEDVDAVYARAVRAGATTLGAPSDRPYGDRAAEVADPFGNHWFIATRLEHLRRR